MPRCVRIHGGVCGIAEVHRHTRRPGITTRGIGRNVCSWTVVLNPTLRWRPPRQCALSNGTSPLTAMTIGQLRQLGYDINCGAAPMIAVMDRLRGLRDPSTKLHETLSRLQWSIDASGRLIRLASPGPNSRNRNNHRAAHVSLTEPSGTDRRAAHSHRPHTFLRHGAFLCPVVACFRPYS